MSTLQTEDTPKQLSELGFHEIMLQAYWDTASQQVVYSEEKIKLKRLSEAERESFMAKRMPWLREQVANVTQRLTAAAYLSFHEEMVDALGPLCADKEDLALLRKLGEDASTYRWALRALPSQFVLAEYGVDTSTLPDPDEVDSMTDEKVQGLGES